MRIRIVSQHIACSLICGAALFCCAWVYRWQLAVLPLTFYYSHFRYGSAFGLCDWHSLSSSFDVAAEWFGEGGARIPIDESVFSSLRWCALLFGSSDGWMLFWSGSADLAYGFVRSAMALAVLLLLAAVLLRVAFRESGREWRESSLPARFFEGRVDPVFGAIGLYVSEAASLLSSMPYRAMLVLAAAFSAGVVPIVWSFMAEYVHLLVTLDWAALGDWLGFALRCVMYFLARTPFIAYPIAVYAAVRAIRKRRAEDRLLRLRSENRRTAREMAGVFTFILGKMRGGKTTLNVSLALSIEETFKEDCKENMGDIQKMLPDFPFQAFERDIDRLSFDGHSIRNVQQASSFADSLLDSGDDVYGMIVPDPEAKVGFGADPLTLREALRAYAESYFVYSFPESLIVSNFPIRDDLARDSMGHLPLWDLSRMDPSVPECPTYSKVLHFDSLRFRRKANPGDPYSSVIGPSVVCITEMGKEIGNMVSNERYSQKDERANPKNDGFDMSAKLGGHMANVWHKNLFRMIGDEQRSGSMSANMTEIAENVVVASRQSREEGTALRMNDLSSLLLELSMRILDALYDSYRFAREDTTLLFIAIRRLRGWCARKIKEAESLYGYATYTLPIFSSDSVGGLSPTGESVKWHVLNRVEYAGRFESACMKRFLNEGKGEAKAGLRDVPQYGGLMPSEDEWDSQGSYMVRDLKEGKARPADGAEGDARPSRPADPFGTASTDEERSQKVAINSQKFGGGE